MYDNKKVLAIITARGGSKGVPGKNIRLLGDKPLLAWTIDAANGSSYIDKTILSTDDMDIARVAREYGCDVPFMRPSELAQDKTATVPVLEHAIESLNEKFDIIVLLQPTSPFRQAEHIDDCLKLYIKNKHGAVVSIKESDDSPYWSFNYSGEDCRLSPIFPEHVGGSGRRQDTQKSYHLNGAIYVIGTDQLLQERTMLIDNTGGYLMDDISSIDIDTPLDFMIAQNVLELRNEKKFD